MMTDTDMLAALINHAALPPNAPHKLENNIEDVNRELGYRLLGACRKIRDLTSSIQTEYGLWESARLTLSGSLSFHNDGPIIDAKCLQAEICDLQSDRFLILYILEQNAGVLIYKANRNDGLHVVFEAFEATASSDQTMAATDALMRSFPGRAVEVPLATFDKSEFQDQIAFEFERMSDESVKRFCATSRKDGTGTHESRETASPELVAGWFLSVLEGLGRAIEVPLLQKRTYDDVNWRNAERPWRRSAFLTVLRTGLERFLLHINAENGRVLYKYLVLVFLAELLNESIGVVSDENLEHLRRKICRRKAKLEVERAQCQIEQTLKTFTLYAQYVGAFVERVNSAATKHLDEQTYIFKRRCAQTVPTFQQHVPANELQLKLSNSRGYINEILNRPFDEVLQQKLDYANAVDRDRMNFIIRHRDNAAREASLRAVVASMGAGRRQGSIITQVSREINQYIDHVNDQQDISTYQMSLILLLIMESWIRIDKAATALYPLLTEFVPPFRSEMLDVLRICNLADMERLNDIQTYLNSRSNEAGDDACTIFAFRSGCFAERYFDHNEDLQSVHDKIVSDATAERAAKQAEWTRLDQKWQTSNDSYRLKSHWDDRNKRYINSHADPHNKRKCEKCRLFFDMKKIKIAVHEWPLVKKSFAAKATVFELAAPDALRLYRDTTFRILRHFALRITAKQQECHTTVREYVGLSKHITAFYSGTVSLGSRTKSEYQTHREAVKFQVELSKICTKSNLSLAYVDNTGQATWIPDLEAEPPSFAHHFVDSFLKNTPFSLLASRPGYSVSGKGPSSNDIIASQIQCPTTIGPLEWTAFQTLFAGFERRWPQILHELASSDLNFSSDAVVLLIERLATQAGPSSSSGLYRVVHKPLQEDTFRRNLCAQLQSRLEGLQSNWRETMTMRLIVTIALRLCAFPDARGANNDGLQILRLAREVLQAWIRELKIMHDSAEDSQSATQYSRYAVEASLLSKRTFTALTLVPDDSGCTMTQEEAQCFIESSIALYDHLVDDLKDLSQRTRSDLIEDCQLGYKLEPIFYRSLLRFPEAILHAVSSLWPVQYPFWMVLSYTQAALPREHWLEMGVQMSNGAHIHISYHAMAGCLYINNDRQARLPDNLSQDPILHELFSRQSFQAIASPEPGMAYTLSLGRPGISVHLGFRNGKTVVRLVSAETKLELVPRRVFGSFENGDLPTPLLENRTHWLDLTSHKIRIRDISNIFDNDADDWVIDLGRNVAHRGDGAHLVERGTATYRNLTEVFRNFERSNRLLVLQRADNVLGVEMPTAELSFAVNEWGLISCEQLHGELLTVQDCGTWHGLLSKLVFQDLVNPAIQFVIVPLGHISWKLKGSYATVMIQNDGGYGKFTVNRENCRLDSPTEPSLLYWKALLHALTSLNRNDELTLMTGTEAALRSLESSLSKPQSPLADRSHEILQKLAGLTPVRHYYPEGRRIQQTIEWDQELPFWSQHEDFVPLVQRLYSLSNELVVFTPGSSSLRLATHGDDQLRLRASARRARYESCPESLRRDKRDSLYEPRDIPEFSRRQINVFQCSALLDKWRGGFVTCRSLTLALSGTIGGFEGVAPVHLSDRFSLRPPEKFGALVEMCRSANEADKYRLMFMLSPFCYNDANTEILRVLIAIAILPELKVPQVPHWPLFEGFVQERVAPTSDHLIVIMEPHAVAFANQIQVRPGRRTLTAQQMEDQVAGEKLWKDEVRLAFAEVSNSIISCEPHDDVRLADLSASRHIDTASAAEAAIAEWKRLNANLEFWDYLIELQGILDKVKVDQKLPKLTKDRQRPCPEVRSTSSVHVTAHELLRLPRVETFPPAFTWDERIDAQLMINDDWLSDPQDEVAHAKTAEDHELGFLLSSLQAKGSAVHRKYADTLESSQAAARLARPGSRPNTIARQPISEQIGEAQKKLDDFLSWMQTELRSRHAGSKWLINAGLWPSMNTGLLLSELGSNASHDLPGSEKSMLIKLGLHVNALQRLKRIEDAEKRRASVRASQEIANRGHVNWYPAEYPDWLLIEVDSNVTIRPEQIDVAIATINPPSRANSCLQLNMGGGKSSLILPMCAAVLADRQQLVRVVVPRALLIQTSQILQSKLGGLLNRDIYHIPYSRRTPHDPGNVSKFRGFHETALHSGGVMLCLPEHMLSFKLSGEQCLADGKLESGKLMVNAQTWLEEHSRDIIDECDDILSVKQQLVFPSGTQLAVDGHPYRWEIVEELLTAAANHAEHLAANFPESIEVVVRKGTTYPIIFFLQQGAEESLIRHLVDDVCSGSMRSLPLDNATEAEIEHIRQYLTKSDISVSLSKSIKRLFPNDPAARSTIYLLRGLLTYGILLMTLKRKWNVQYGLHAARAPIAVPYYAKGSPSDHAEWGHPDVSLLFTVLSFLYGGLNKSQVKQSLDHLLHSDDAGNEYRRWIDASAGVPAGLQEWSHLNTSDSIQLKDLWQHLSHNELVIKYFLNRFVFPTHAKQFATKFQASGWNLPLFSPSTLEEDITATSLRPMTTGFSGTNDQRDLLPFTIKQNDLPALSSTNAEMLKVLLEQRNREYVQLTDVLGRRLSEFGILRLLTEKGVSVLIDAGASIVAATNQDLVIEWLRIWPSAPAAVYFNRHGKAMVRYRTGKEVTLVASPYAEDLSSLLVFVDHQHVRGVDLKFPVNARGAVTLALGQTKDHTVQAAMRLRQLQSSQSVCWLAPPEVNQSIVDSMAPNRSGKLDSYDVVWWLLEQTCRSIAQNMPLFTVQGETFCEQLQARIRSPNITGNDAQRKKFLSTITQVERQSLEDLYDPLTQQKAPLDPQSFAAGLQPFISQLRANREEFQSTGVFHAGALEEVEQEREVTAESEVIRELQKPADYKGLKPARLHSDIRDFIRTGDLHHASEAWVDVFTAMSETTVGMKYGVRGSRSGLHLFVSLEYKRTIQTPHKQFLDNFIRPANWLLVSPWNQQALLVSPEEAEAILPIVRDRRAPRVHLVLYSAAVTKKMRAFEDLRFYAVPVLPQGWAPHTTLETLLGLYAGSLYFDHDMYLELRQFLRDCGSTDRAHDSRLAHEGVLIYRPLAFYKAWLDVRRKGQEFYETPAGYVSQGKKLRPEHRFFKVDRS